MQPLLYLVIEVAISVAAIKQSILLVEIYEGHARELRFLWEEELLAHSCGARAAAQANLQDAARWLHDEAGLSLEESESAVADILSQPLYDLSGCLSSGSTFAYVLHREQSRKFSEFWPNWVFRLQRNSLDYEDGAAGELRSF